MMKDGSITKADTVAEIERRCVGAFLQMLDDGSLYIADVGLQHVGNYSCHDERWPDVSQTHILDVHGTDVG